MEGSSEDPYDIENLFTPLLISMGQTQENDLPPSPDPCCIYRVPEPLRCVNEKAYTPQLVSIGPLHHGKEGLEEMEGHKRRYLQYFLERTGVSEKDYVTKIKGKEEELRSCYAHTIEFSSEKFVEIILVDAAFIIELLLRRDGEHIKPDSNDRIFYKPGFINFMVPDMLLLENQLPFFILEDLFSWTQKSEEDLLPIEDQQMILLLIRERDRGFIGFNKIKNKNKQNSSIDPLHIAEDQNDLHSYFLTISSKGKLKTCLFDIKFSGGILEIPKITINDTTNMRVRNLLAFEQCHTKEANYLTNYVFLMKRLAKTPKDVELLVENGIIENWLGDTKKISTLLHDLGTRVIVSNHYYATLCEDLNNYCRTPRHKWMANLRQNYFNSPWSIISVAAAVILLILTFIQTVCSIKSTA
ncbi:hypothetical protein D8674_014993 [Pyrus ussuriensis x Pyrus communis]|uniref:Uncharacterized protein n=1 Tax=Pyrus ussuriensis x Pyrus communis TaxID=2448454 RepID=A0A5N5H7L0_9ROSA|nr:hypothetical protein D8674_014993 [Pyrus ussuriensis x Pyrus communis]